MSHAHSHSPHEPSPEFAARQRRALGSMVTVLVPVAVLTLVALVWLWPRNVSAHISNDAGSVTAPGVTLQAATVTAVTRTSCSGDQSTVGNDPRPCADLTVRLDDGPEKDQTQKVQLNAATYSSGARAGQHVKLYRLPAGQGSETSYQFAEFSRGTPMVFFGVLFALVVVAVARWRGLSSLFGLVFAFVVLWKFLFPALVVGHNPVLVGLAASCAIMYVVLYTAHGFSTRTTTALVGTLAGIAVTAALGTWAVHWAHLTGVAGEDDLLLTASATDLRLHSALMCGVIIAGLGVLNDVTITQASAVWELAEQGRGRKQLFGQAMRIGRDHIASTVYTTAFGAAGASLSVLLLLSIYQRPLGQVLTSEMFAEEVIRTLVGGIGLVLAVPITTAIAVLAVTAGRPLPVAGSWRPEARREDAPATVRQQTSTSGPARPRGSRARRAEHAQDDLYRRPQHGRDEM